MKKRLRHIVKKFASFYSEVKSYFSEPVIYTSCDEIKKWNFDKISETNDLKYLVAGTEYGKKAEAPENAAEIWDNILQEYTEKTENDKALIYFELLSDIDDLEMRIYFVEIILIKLQKHSTWMNEDIKKEYVELLKERRFYFNASKPMRAEIERLERQLKAARTKLQFMLTEAEAFVEKNFKSKNISSTTIKVKIQRALKMHIDFKETTVTEFLEWIKEVTQSNNG